MIRWSTLVLAAICLNSSAWAAWKIGNGGDGVIDPDGRIYSLDLVESGVEKAPFFDPAINPKPELFARLELNLGFMDTESLTLLARKLAEVEVLDAGQAFALEAAIASFRWVLLDRPLVDIADEETNLRIPTEQLVQVAVRSNYSIQITRAAWDRMDGASRAALVLHEVFYALAPLRSVPTNDGRPAYEQSSPPTREIVGYLFSKEFKRRGQRGFRLFSEKFRGFGSGGLPTITWDFWDRNPPLAFDPITGTAEFVSSVLIRSGLTYEAYQDYDDIVFGMTVRRKRWAKSYASASMTYVPGGASDFMEACFVRIPSGGRVTTALNTTLIPQKNEIRYGFKSYVDAQGYERQAFRAVKGFADITFSTETFSSSNTGDCVEGIRRRVEKFGALAKEP